MLQSVSSHICKNSYRPFLELRCSYISILMYDPDSEEVSPFTKFRSVFGFSDSTALPVLPRPSQVAPHSPEHVALPSLKPTGLKLPNIIKKPEVNHHPRAKKSNQLDSPQNKEGGCEDGLLETESNNSSRRKVEEKNKKYIKELERNKRLEKEKQERKERRLRMKHEQRTRELALKQQERAKAGIKISNQRAENGPKLSDTRVEQVECTEEEESEEKKLMRKKLLLQQKSLLAKLQAKQKEEAKLQEELQRKAKKKESKVKKKVLESIYKSKEEKEITNCHGVSVESLPCPDTNKVSPEVDEEEEKRRKMKAKKKEKARRQKQMEYLAQLAIQRQLKQEEEEKQRMMEEKQRQKIREDAAKVLQKAAEDYKLMLGQREEEEQRLAEEKERQRKEREANVDIDAMVERLSKVSEKESMSVNERIQDLTRWKKRNGAGPDQKVFVVTGWYPVIREELERRGWMHNSDRNSACFDFKWALKSEDLKATSLEKWQITNHFKKNTAITTKVGLLQNLKQHLLWQCDERWEAFFPMAFDLNDQEEMSAFQEEFKYIYAEGLLKKVAKAVLETDVEVNAGLLDVLLRIAERKLRSWKAGMSLEESVDMEDVGKKQVSSLEWALLKLIGRESMYAALDGKLDLEYVSETTIAPEDYESLPTKEKKAIKMQEQKKKALFREEESRLNRLLAVSEHLDEDRKSTFVGLVRQLATHNPQFDINGGSRRLFNNSALPHVDSENVWIVKPAGMSRGRGIKVFNDLDALLEYTSVETQKESQWVAQKYIENPLLVSKRKFDIRQWVLVTDWDPLTVWSYGDCYIRLSCEAYDIANLHDAYVHLTNNSVQKYSDKFEDTYDLYSSVEISREEMSQIQVEGNMLHSRDFAKYLSMMVGKPAEEIWDANVKKEMQRIIAASLQSVQDVVEPRKNSFELYGYDFMIDEDCKPWLIEVNSSPACDYSTKVTQEYVEGGLKGLLAVVLDGPNEPNKDKICGWERVHKGESIGKPPVSGVIGIDFHAKGVKMKRHRHRVKQADPVEKEESDMETETTQL